ncbi:MAG: hypothetical protein DSY76_06455 [Bacteroidetes bacterium]|nr:MAG: hypothetical protein DSY76_06455 [Bacteroidota bacterium]
MKRFLFISLIFFSVLSSWGQSDFNFGFQLGLNGSQVTGDQLAGFHKAGLFGGLFVNHKAGRLGNIQLEMNFTQKGSRKNAKPDEGIYDSYLMRLNYVAVPLLYRFKIKKTLDIDLGLEAAYLISSRERDINGWVEPDLSVPYFKDFDFSIFAGIGVEINEHLLFVFRYSYSIVPIRPRPPGNYYYGYWDAGQYNEVVTGTLQYQF